MVANSGDEVWLSKSENEIRESLKRASDEELERLLTEREIEALRFGYRERVTDTHLRHVEELPRDLPQIFASAASRAREAGFHAEKKNCE